MSEQTLRDHFAAAALQGWLAGPCGGDVLDAYEDNPKAFAEHQRKVAKACYGYAAAMLAERAKRASRNLRRAALAKRDGQ